jgi:hypothetical protein
MEDTQVEKNGYTKPGYDARLQYYEVIKKYMINISNAQYYGDFASWIRLLLGMYSLLKGYVDPEKAKDIKDKLIKIRKQHNVTNPDKVISSAHKKTLNNVLDIKLQEITEDIYVCAKHMFLPISEETEEDFDENVFTRESWK